MTRKPTLPEFKKWANDCRPAAVAVCEAMAFAKLQRERVDAYIKPIFDGWGFTYGADHGDRAGKLIPSPARLYCCDDEGGIAAFFAECDEAHRKHGFKGKLGHCPALEAENLQIIVENALIELAKPLFGVEIHQLTLEKRQQYLDLLIGGCLNAERMAA